MKTQILAAALALTSLTATAQQSNVAYQDAHVRFTVITDGVVRMEYSPAGKFTDDRSFLRSETQYPEVKYTLKNSGSQVQIATSKMTMTYKKNTGAFDEKNLTITSAKKAKVPFSWKPGTKQTGNLKGTSRTLDGFDGDKHRGWGYETTYDYVMELEDGLIATCGWTLLDDSKGLLFDNSDWAWVKEREEKDGQDLYFMAYGHDYKQALTDYITFAGKIPLPPRYAFGYWWSRYWSYSDAEMRDLVSTFKKYDIPLDVFVVDMDWHYVEEGKGAWTGYTWNRKLFPDPAKFLGFLKDNNLQITLNLHPAGGILPYEEKYPQMAKWMGIDPASKQTINYQGSNKRFMEGWMENILRPMEKEGVNFWWLDWQQWPNDSTITSLSNTWWLNYCFFTEQERNSQYRPMLYHRWGGLGNHRYQVGFSGDTYSSWASLAYQPYFNHTASNVGYGYWSHDLGGHMLETPDALLNKELYIRWMQFGEFNPIMRSHSTKSAELKKEPWNQGPENMEILRDIINGRYQLAPYIYTTARQAYETGVSLCRPMYYDYPEASEAFEFQNQYMFGDEMMIAPIVAPAVDGISTLKVWLPAGCQWFEWQTGTLLEGGQIVEREFTLDEYPVYVKAGAILPLYEKVKNLRNNDEDLVFQVFPGNEGSYTLYEDQGNSKDYKTQYATTALTSKMDGNVLKVNLAARQGSYAEMPAQRTYKVRVIASAIPAEVKVNGKAASYEYNGEKLTLTVVLPNANCAQAQEVVITYPETTPVLTDGLLTKMKAVKKTMSEMKFRDAGIDYVDGLGEMGSLGQALEYFPAEFNARVQAFRDNYATLPALLDKQKLKDVDKTWFLKSVNWKE